MEIFAIIATLIFLVFGSILLLSPESFKKISDATNRVLVTLDSKVPRMRRPIGIFFLVLCIFLWYIALSK